MCRTGLGLLIAIFILATGVSGDEPESPDLHILFTNSANGAVENCHCPEHPLGGLEKRALFIESYLKKHPETLVLDNGDNFTEDILDDVSKIAVEAFRIIPYDVINPGDQDIASAPEAYLEMHAVARNPNRPVTVEKAGYTVSVMPYLHPSTTIFYPEFVFENYNLQSPDAVLPEWIEESKDADLRILLSHSGFENDAEIAEIFPEIDLICGGHSQTVLDSLLLFNNIPVVQAGGNAYYVGVLVLGKLSGGWKVKSHRLEPMTLEMPDHPIIAPMLKQWHRKQEEKRKSYKNSRTSP